MRKKLLIALGAAVIIVVAGLLYLNNRNRTLSPPGEAQITKGNLEVRIKYSRPSVRNRLIFGTEEEGALQPYGQYWRLGANEVTTISVNQDVRFNGKSLKAGTYGMYAIPGKDAFVIGVNPDADRWGYAEADYENDVFTTSVPVIYEENPVEQYTISMTSEGSSVVVTFEWSDVKFQVPIESSL